MHGNKLIFMSIAFNYLTMMLLTRPSAVVLSACIGVGGCLCPKKSYLRNDAPSLDSAAEAITVGMILVIVSTAPLL